MHPLSGFSLGSPGKRNDKALLAGRAGLCFTRFSGIPFSPMHLWMFWEGPFLNPAALRLRGASVALNGCAPLDQANLALPYRRGGVW